MLKVEFAFKFAHIENNHLASVDYQLPNGAIKQLTVLIQETALEIVYLFAKKQVILIVSVEMR